jgi:predicted ATPase
MIETHSEYLLLRCLRRIRETTLGKQLPNSPLSLSKEDVSVLYFDPQPDGTTTVKQLRVSTQGDFIDRWPRGFFDERAKDIFDV